MRQLILMGTLAAGLSSAPATAQDCPAAVPFEAQDRLADLSARCGVAAGAILRANDAANEAALRQIGAVAIPQASHDAETGLLDRALGVAEDTAEQAEGLATRAGDAASDHLSENDIGENLLDSRQSGSLLSADADGPERAQLSAVALDAERIRIAATGLPDSQTVTIAVLRGEELVPLREVETDPDGTLLTGVPSPEGADKGGMVLAVETNGRRLATAPVEQPRDAR